MPGFIYAWLRGKYVHFYVAQANVNARRSYASAYTARQCSLAMMVTPSWAKTPSHALTGCGRESLCNVNVQLILLLLAVDCGAVHGAVDCGAPETIEKGRVDYTETYHSKAQYSCNPCYYLQGWEKRSCKQSGVWSKELPSCVLKGEVVKYYIVHVYK